MKIIALFQGQPQPLPLLESQIVAGFPSPAEDYIERSLDLSEHLIPHPSATYFVRVSGDSMTDLGIHDGDLLIVDRSLEALHGDVVVAALNGELTCKVLDRRQRRLLSGNSRFPPIPITGDFDFVVEGVVTASIRYHRCLR